MARSKRSRKRGKHEVESKEEVYDEPDPEGDDYFHDDIDKFHAEREKILLDSSVYNKDKEEGFDTENQQDEEVIALDIGDSDEESDDSDDDDDDESDINTDDLEEDDEVDEEDEEESGKEEDGGKGMPSQKSWGRKKSAFYDADIVEEYAGSDEEMDKLAEEEEEEALALQRQIAASLEEQDFDAADFELPQTPHKKVKEVELNKEKVVQDLTKLSKTEKIQILIKDSPELLGLLDEFKLKLKEVTEKLHPLVKMARAGQVPKEGADYLELKHQLYLNYCVNIGFYLLLKARQTSVRDHPVIERLLQYKKLLTELEPLDERFKPEIEEFLTKSQILRQNGTQKENDSKADSSQEQSEKPQKSVKLSSLLDDSDDDYGEAGDGKNENKAKKTSEKGKEGKLNKLQKGIKGKRKMEEDVEETDPLEYYEAVRLQKKMKREAKEAAYRFTPEQYDAKEEESEEGKRGITYEISQNKGLTAKKKKELRNPRVKHRRKFYKAQIKRKSQVLPVVNEQNRYGGEMTGIRSHLTRSIKIK
ncbi:something about silencing protein 10-like [Stylophora pistillata]|uniref:something about silencing protein 10-like n=1 Tax=Stylophora pistillata TaxID=50429 RepID=UPI000C039E9A|nr:something about silencing protein 10-like [Stylophora pistillata]